MIVSVGGKVSDMFSLMSADRTVDYNGYVPNSSLGCGDYIHFQVDNETGQILNWVPLNFEEIMDT